MNENKPPTLAERNAMLMLKNEQLRKNIKELTKKKKMQFSQKMTVASSVFSMAIVVVVLIANFVLLILGKQPMEQETITTITVYGGLTSTLTLGGYLALSGVRDCSKNKHGIKETEKEE